MMKITESILLFMYPKCEEISAEIYARRVEKQSTDKGRDASAYVLQIKTKMIIQQIYLIISCKYERNVLY